MKKIIIFSTILIISYFFNVGASNATVGGPTYISNIQSALDNASEIIYEVHSQGGRGCPPEIYSQNIQTGEKKVVLSCNQSEKLSNLDYETEREVTLAKYPTILKRIDLNKNKVTAVTTAIDVQEIDEAKGFFGKTDFTIDIFQNNVKKTTLTYSGCKANQQHIIEGYKTPDNMYLVLVVSTIGDCFEGGYTAQRLFIVPNITFYDSTSLPVIANEDPAPGIGNLSFIAKISSETPNQNGTGTTGKNNTATVNYQIIIAILIVIVISLAVQRSKNK